MNVADKIVVVTGAASGIGRALARRFDRAGAKSVVVADVDADGARAVADEIGGVAVPTDVGVEADIVALIDRTESEFGPIDLFCSNAGIAVPGGLEVDDEVWDRVWRINTMSHVWAARHLVPRMVARGGGYLFSTASAAGLLAQIGSVTYSVSKHAAVALAEWLSIHHHDDGIRVTVLCPQAVRTAMTTDGEDTVVGAASVDGMLEPEAVADDCLSAIEAEQFFVLPHPVVAEYMKRKATDPDRWLNGMRKLKARYDDNA